MTAPSHVEAELLAAMQAGEDARFAAEFDAARKAADTILNQIIIKHNRNSLAIYEGRPTERTPIRVTPALALPNDLDPEPLDVAKGPPSFVGMVFGKP